MSQAIVSRCYYCGLLVDPQRDDLCRNCNFPASPGKEKGYLTSVLSSLQQAMSFGGAQLKVAELYLRYQSRLRTLQKLTAASVMPSNAPDVAPPASGRVA